MKAIFENILNWLKINVVLVVSAILILLSLGLLGMVHLKGATFVETVAKRGDDLKRIEGLQKTPVQIPPEKADGPLETVPITVNQKAIDEISTVYARLKDEYTKIFRFAVFEVNQQGHLPMLEGLFPEPSRVEARPYQARIRYRRIMMGDPRVKAPPEMLEPYSPTAGYPQIDAKPPLSQAEIKIAMDKIESEFVGVRSVTQLTPDELEKLNKLKSAGLIKALTDHARTFHVYAATDPGHPEFPLDILDWYKASDKPPTDEEIWEGQMRIWIQQDICRAIAETNRVSDRMANVANMPIKRLLKIAIRPGNITDPSKKAAPTTGRIPPVFAASPTGRYSNPLYDVRHVSVSLVADVQRLPEFFNQLSTINFMTVLRMELIDVDEYDALRQGYFYGPGDAVQINFDVETIWMRDWTAKLMPERIRTGAVTVVGVKPGAAAAPAIVPIAPVPTPEQSNED